MKQEEKGHVTIIVELRGELCNHLSLLASARITQLMAQARGIQTKIVGQHQDRPKWRHARDDLRKCFTNFQSFQFRAAKWDKSQNFQKRQRQQEEWLTQRQRQMLTNARGEGLELLSQLLNHTKATLAYNSKTKSGYQYSLPYLTTTQFSTWEVLTEKNYRAIADLFQFNDSNPECCQLKPYADETVLHVRNFFTELNGAWEKGFRELSPNNVASMLFAKSLASHNAPPRIAIVSRFTSTVQPYVDQLKTQYNASVRVISNQTGLQDFCFLKETQHQLIGTYTSTYAIWGGILGKAPLVRLYEIETLLPGDLPRTLDIYSQPLFSLTRTLANRSFLYETFYQSQPYQPEPSLATD